MEKDQKEVFVFFLVSAWPVLLAITGSIIMYFASNGYCNRCSVFQFIVDGMYGWGWIGVAFIVIALLRFAYVFVISIINLFKEN